MNWTCAFNALMSTASLLLLLPQTAASESHVQTAAPTTAVAATASVNFKIVIPKVLFLQMGDGSSHSRDTQRMTITSNGRTVSFSEARGNLILSAAARKGIAQEAQCRLGNGPAATVTGRTTICTVSTP